MKYIPHPIAKVFSLIPTVHADHRGNFMELLRESEMSEAVGQEVRFVQENKIFSRFKVLRGFHYNLKGNQGKLVSSWKGTHVSYALCMDRESPDYGKMASQFLIAKEHTQFWVPPGFAHALVCLTEGGIASYKSTQYYDGENERSLSYRAFDFPLALENAIVSDKDQIVQSLDEFWRLYG